MPRRGRSWWRWRRCLPPPPPTRSCSGCTRTPRPQPAPCLLTAHVPAAASTVTLPAKSRPWSGQAMVLQTVALSPFGMNHGMNTLQLMCLPRSLYHLAQSYACNHSVREDRRPRGDIGPGPGTAFRHLESVTHSQAGCFARWPQARHSQGDQSSMARSRIRNTTRLRHRHDDMFLGRTQKLNTACEEEKSYE